MNPYDPQGQWSDTPMLDAFIAQLEAMPQPDLPDVELSPEFIAALFDDRYDECGCRNITRSEECLILAAIEFVRMNNLVAGPLTRAVQAVRKERGE